jgi:hypothetical protein
MGIILGFQAKTLTQHLNGVQIKRSPIAINEGLLQLDGGNITTVIAVDRSEPLS